MRSHDPHVYRDTIFQASAAEKPQGTVSPLRGHLCVLEAIARTRRSRERSNAKTGRTGEPATRRSGQGHNGDGANEGQTNNVKVASTWQDQGTLTVHRLRKTATPHPLPPRTNSLRRQLRCTSSSTGEKAALGFAVGNFCFPKNEWPTANFAREQIPLQMKPPAYASASNLGVAMARWIKCARQNC